MSGFFGTANAAESVPAGTIAGGSSPAPILTPPPSPPPVQMAMNAPTIVGGSTSQPTAAAFDARFKGSPLEGKWDVIKSSAESRGIPPALAASIMAQETGNGKNVKFNNPGGLMDPKSPDQKTKMQFQSIDHGIDASVKTMAKIYGQAGGDLNRMAGIYAPVGVKNDNGTNKDWLPGVSKIMGSLGGI